MLPFYKIDDRLECVITSFRYQGIVKKDLPSIRCKD